MSILAKFGVLEIKKKWNILLRYVSGNALFERYRIKIFHVSDTQLQAKSGV